MIEIKSLYRYPVKGLSPEALVRAALTVGETIPFDRAYAVERVPGKFDPANPKFLPKINFLMLMRDESLAALKTTFDDAGQKLTVLRDGQEVASGDLRTTAGRLEIETFLASYLQETSGNGWRGTPSSDDLPRIVMAENHTFSDVPAKCVHIVNLATVRDVERTLERAVDPIRFRANIYIDGAAPWEEFDWLDKTLSIGGAAVQVFTRTERCAATNVDPTTGARDMRLPEAIRKQWGHSDFGLYARVVAGGTVAAGDRISVG